MSSVQLPTVQGKIALPGTDLDISSEREMVTDNLVQFLLDMQKREAEKCRYSVPLTRLTPGDIYILSGKAPKWSDIDPYSSLEEELDTNTNNEITLTPITVEQDKQLEQKTYELRK